MPEVDDKRYELAKKRVEETKGFFIHLGTYVIVISALFAIDLLTGSGIQWAYWPALGWGIGIAIHAFSYVVDERLFGAEWEERKIQETLARDEHRLDKTA